MTELLHFIEGSPVLYHGDTYIPISSLGDGLYLAIRAGEMLPASVVLIAIENERLQ